MYGKVFEQMYKGSMITAGWEAIVTMQQLIILADQEGDVEMTPQALSNTTTIPLEHIEKGLEALILPDPMSRSKSNEGRRIILMDEDRPWGWHLVNYKYYVGLASKADKKIKDRDRQRANREKPKENIRVAKCRGVSQNVAHIDVDIDVNIPKEPMSNSNELDEKEFESFWNVVPRKDKKKESKRVFLKLNKVNRMKAIMDYGNRYVDTDKQYIPAPPAYLRGELWDNELITKEAYTPKTKDEWVKYGQTVKIFSKPGEEYPEYIRRLQEHRR